MRYTITVPLADIMPMIREKASMHLEPGLTNAIEDHPELVPVTIQSEYAIVSFDSDELAKAANL